MVIRHLIITLLSLGIFLPAMAQVDDDRSYQGIRIGGKTGAGEILPVGILPLGNGVLYFRDGRDKSPLDGTYRLIAHENMYYIGHISKGLADGDWEEHRYDRLTEKATYRRGRVDGILHSYSSGYSGQYTFEEGVPKHYISYFDNDQLRLERFYDENGKIHGEVKTYDKDGTLVSEAYYEKGHQQGTGMSRNREGHTIVCEYEDGRKVGAYSRLYPNGAVAEKGTYSLGEKKEGFWIFGEENGELRTEAHYENDRLHGIKRDYYAGGKLKSQEEYLDGKLNGEVVYYDEKPYLKTSEGVFLEGKRHGMFRVYHDGILWRETIYQNDRLVGKKEYADGKLQIIQLLDETGTMIDVGKYDPTGKRVYRNQNYTPPSTLKLRENAYGVIDVEF